MDPHMRVYTQRQWRTTQTVIMWLWLTCSLVLLLPALLLASHELPVILLVVTLTSAALSLAMVVLCTCDKLANLGEAHFQDTECSRRDGRSPHNRPAHTRGLSRGWPA
jgi:hypothetical protein